MREEGRPWPGERAHPSEAASRGCEEARDVPKGARATSASTWACCAAAAERGRTEPACIAACCKQDEEGGRREDEDRLEGALPEEEAEHGRWEGTEPWCSGRRAAWQRETGASHIQAERTEERRAAGGEDVAAQSCSEEEEAAASARG